MGSSKTYIRREIQIIMKYPRIPHDEKKSTRVSLTRIELIKKSYIKYHNYRLVGRIFHISPTTVMGYVKGEEYRKRRNKKSTENHKERMKNPEYRDRMNKLSVISNKDRMGRYPQIRQYYRELDKKYYQRKVNKKQQE